MLPARREPRPTARVHGGFRELGFTLIELFSVMAIIAILMGIAVGTLRGAKQRAAIARTRSELALLVQALEDYKRHYGDYPQTGPSANNSQKVTLSSAGVSVGPGLNTAQALLFNSLTGVYGPTGLLGGRINGPSFVDVSKFTLEVALVNATFGIPTGTPPAKPTVNNSFLDPWGNRYLYFYKRASPAATSSAGSGGVISGGAGISAGAGAVSAAPVQAWAAPAFVLYSTGPDGASTTLPAANGIFTGTTQTTGDNADNIYADKLQ